jgi:trimethylamine:corrinoid methyltransferase-like protein
LYREQRVKPTLFELRLYAEWQKNSASFIERAEKRLNDIRRNHEVPPFESALEKELERIIRTADDELAA